MNNKILKRIGHYMELGKVSVFVGAGVSRLSGYPSWNKLVRKMSDEIGYTRPAEEKNFSSDELLKIPQMYCNERGYETYLEKVKDIFSGTYEINEVHDLILSLKPKHLLTTNYDTLLEQTAVKFGVNYSLINGDKSVSSCISNNYIIKLHGDLQAGFVLKEDDYLNYESKYMLVDKIVKSIFATSLVIFIGYGLNDYNIKLILNWVKNVQADTFIKPVFIHTDKPLSKIERTYQMNRGVDVLDCNDFGILEQDDYLKRYKVVLQTIIDEAKHLNNNDEEMGIKKINDQVSGIKNLQYIRSSDFNMILKHKYHIDEASFIKSIYDIQNVDRKQDYSIFFINDNVKKKFPSFYKFVEHCKLEKFGHGLKKRDISNIENESFFFQFELMQQYCSYDYVNEHDNFKKAYYLGMLSRFEESYVLFTKLLLDLKNNEEWDLYYLAQVNRVYLYKIITQSSISSQTFCKWNFDKDINIYKEDFLKNLRSEMENFDKQHQFDYLPVEFQAKFPFLKNLCDDNPYSYKLKNLIKKRNKILQDTVDKTTYIAGMCKADAVKSEALEEVQFIYENMLLFTNFEEFKDYIKTAMIIWVEYYSKECEQIIRGQKNEKNCNYKFTFTDIVILSKVCNKEDIEYLIRINVFNYMKLDNEEIEKLKKYITDQLKVYSKIIGKDKYVEGETIYLWREKSVELHLLLQVASYYICDEKTILILFDIMREIVNSCLMLPDIVRIIKSFIQKSEIQENILIKYIENWLIELLNEQELDPFNLVSELLVDYSGDNKLKSLSRLIVNGHLDEKYLEIMNNLYLLLNDEAREKVRYKQNFTVENVKRMFRETKILDKTIVYEACKNSFNKILANRALEQKGVKVSFSIYSDDAIITTGIILLLENECDDDTFFKKYIGINSEYDYWFSDKVFQDEEINIQWIKYYSDTVLNIIKKNKKRRSQMLRVLTYGRNLRIADEELTKRMFYVYRYLVDNYVIN